MFQRKFVNTAGRSKYGNKKVDAFGLSFDSKKEMQRYVVLKEAQERGEISDLQCQVKYELLPAVKETQTKHLKTKDKEVEVTVQRAIYYIADFVYKKDGETVVEDVKISQAMLPKEFILKSKMFRWKYGIPVRMVFKANEEI